MIHSYPRPSRNANVNSSTLINFWHYLGHVTDSGANNMALDRNLLEEFQQGTRSAPVLRFYQWQTPTISIGKNQIIEEAVDVRQATRLGYDIVMRPTGGRALLHKGDLCYAVIGDRRSHPLFHSLSSTYRAIGSTISQMLQSIGITPSDLPQQGSEARKSLNPCFAMISPFEVLVNGKKICGSAQFRSGEYFLQHGSIRVRNNWNENDLTSLWPGDYRLEAAKVTSIDSELGQLFDFDLVADKLRESFGKVFAISVG